MKVRTSSTVRFCLQTLLPGTVALLLASPAGAANFLFTTNAPSVGANDIANLIGHIPVGSPGGPNAPKASNVGGGDDNSVYLDNGRPIQGQTFRTGPNANGYQLTAVTLRQVLYNTYSEIDDLTYTIRVTLPGTNTLAVLGQETAFVPLDAPNNFPDYGPSGNDAGSGHFLTFTFDTPVTLNPNTTYGFDVGGGGSTQHYWETDGRAGSFGATGPYTNGTAYSSGAGGAGNTSMIVRTGDRVFKVALTPLLAPSPPSIVSQPSPVTLYAGRTASFTALASGSQPLSYQWRRSGTNITDGGNISGTLTTTLTIANISAANAGAYSLFVSNSAGNTNSAVATLTVVAAPPAGNNYLYAILTNNAHAYWRLNENLDPSTNPPAFEYMGGFSGTYGNAALNGFNSIAGPRPSAFPGFESTNNASQSTASTDQSWVTVPGLNLNTNAVTFTAWIYPDGEQPEDVGVFWTRSGTVAGIGYGGSFTDNPNQLMYCWNNADQGTWGFVSGLVIPTNQWSFIAVSIEPTRATLYLGTGGVMTNAVNLIPHISELWSGVGRIGGDPQGTSIARTFNGIVDEVAVFKRALSFDAINNLYGIGRGAVAPVPPSIVVQPVSQSVYAGRTARFAASAVGSSTLNYRWRKNGVNLSDGGNISGALTDALTVANVSAGDVGGYTLVVTNAFGSATSAPPANLSVAVPSGKAYEAAVRAANPVAYWRLNETGDPSTNTAAFDYWGGLAGTYRTNAQNGFNGILGPRPSDFPEFENNNTALQTITLTEQAWVTVPAMNLNTNTVTITAWIKPNIDHNDYQAIFYSRRGATAGIQYTIDNQIGYTWNNGDSQTWQFASELRPPANQWSFVALVIDPNNATLYLYNTNSLASTNNPIPHNAEPWSGSAEIGADSDNGIGRTFDGSIDEVAVFNYAFTPQQILNLYNSAFAPSAPSVTLTIQKVGNNIQLSWPQGTLLEATTVNGPYTTNNATSPYNFAPTGAAKFFRVKVQ